MLLSIGLTTNFGSMIVYGEKYSYITTTATNECGNGFFATEINCANDQSIIAGDHNLANINSISHKGSSSSSYAEDRGALVEELSSDNQNPPVDDDISDTVPNENNNQLTANPTDTNDPSLLVLPCCDEMPAIE